MRLADTEETQLNIHFIMVKHRQKPLQMATIHAEIKLLSRGMRFFFPSHFLIFFLFFSLFRVLFYNNFVVWHSMATIKPSQPESHIHCKMKRAYTKISCMFLTSSNKRNSYCETSKAERESEKNVKKNKIKKRKNKVEQQECNGRQQPLQYNSV